MRVALLSLLTVALHVAASPRPQDIDFDQLIDAIGTATATAAPLAATASSSVATFNLASATVAAAAAIVTDVSTDSSAGDDGTPSEKRQLGASLDKRDGNCSPQGAGGISLPPSSTDSDFLKDNSLHALARNSPDVFENNYAAYALATRGFTSSKNPLVWKDLTAAANAPFYLGYKTLDSYDVKACASYCDSQAASSSSSKCVAFNIYIERDPLQDPGAACPDPAPTGNIKCTIYAASLHTDTAKNTGQYRNKFHVVITASNAYNKLNIVPAPIVDPKLKFGVPAYFNNASINAPSDTDGNGNPIDTYMGTTSFKDGVFDPNKCAVKCDQMSAYEKQYYNGVLPYKTCNFFNVYILEANGSPVQQVCAFYTRRWDSTYAVNTGYTNYDQNIVYTIQASAGYSKVNSAYVRTDLGNSSPQSTP